MITKRHNGHRITFYDGINELPLLRYHLFNKWVMVEAGVGGDAESVDEHYITIMRMLNRGEIDKAKQEFKNLRQNLYFIIQNLHPQSRAFAAMVHSIDGKHYPVRNDSDIDAIIERMNKSRMTFAFISEIAAFLKKKIDDEVATYYPTLDESPSKKEDFTMLRKRTLLVLDSIIEGIDYGDQIADLDDYFFRKIEPQRFDGSEGMEVKHDRNFAAACALINQSRAKDPADMTTLEYLETLDVLKKQQPKKKGRSAYRNKR